MCDLLCLQLKLRSSWSSKRAFLLTANGLLLQNDADGPDEAHQLNHVNVLKKGNVIMAWYTASSETKNKPFKATVEGSRGVNWFLCCIVMCMPVHAHIYVFPGIELA